MSRTSLVVTTINYPTQAMNLLADGAIKHNIDFIVIGDVATPQDFSLGGSRYFSIAAQGDLGSKFAKLCPLKHYARKNIGYLVAIRDGTTKLLETDDDNLPTDGFWQISEKELETKTVKDAGWVNVYRYFSDALIWPRGLPLDEINTTPPSFSALPVDQVISPIQQRLADDNPDVDALYRLILPLPQRFRPDIAVALGNNAWCPFNSQNTAWWPEAYPLLYLPAYCSFRMTDIWRSFVAQRIAWLNGWSILFESPSVWQERNEHNLMRDFEQEISGYLNNRRIAQTLDQLPLKAGVAHIGDAMVLCYQALIDLGVIGAQERPLLEAWLEDIA